MKGFHDSLSKIHYTVISGITDKQHPSCIIQNTEYKYKPRFILYRHLITNPELSNMESLFSKMSNGEFSGLSRSQSMVLMLSLDKSGRYLNLLTYFTIN